MTPEILEGAAEILLLCDHASSHVPADIDLRVDPHLLTLHIALDIGAAALTRALAARLDAPALLGTVSRLVIDLNREADHPGLIPQSSDGHHIIGNAGADRVERIVRFHAPWHHAIAGRVRRQRPALMLAIHSFTPRLAATEEIRPWPIGILYNHDTRAALSALDWLRRQGLNPGDNQPYSGRRFNATLNRHAEAHGIPALAIEIRNDLLGDAAGIARWTDILTALTGYLLAREPFPAT